MNELSDFGLFLLFLLRAFLYALAGGVIMGALDAASHFFWDGKVTKKQYLWALGATFLLGVFIQWQETQHQLATLNQIETMDGNTTHGLNQTIEGLRNSLQEKNNLIQDLKRQNDLLTAKAEAISKESFTAMESLRNQLHTEQRYRSDLEFKLNAKSKLKNVHDQLGILLAEGEQLKRTTMQNTSQPPPFTDADQWVTRVSKLLKKDVSDAAATQFLNPPMMPSYSFGIPKDHESLVNGMEPYLAVLRQITGQLESDIRSGKP